MLGGDARVDDADHDALAGLLHAAGLLPDPAAALLVVTETEESVEVWASGWRI